ncbi:methyl-accepting chemotaxis protein [Azospirillum sp. B510]|uniref:methyl-accepting chemotaxis protein n=1 Tax=Azospirillum sp. (strain B510) TaxID=137722 RepID=UPI0001C4C0F4|nr:HAMP domain-containing methyl-accepting chemotaxis protein [Azospirillum sp. B510]BAI72404.1 methyl-accepting chemotaxis protein [Azospirillum sp. B510]
MHLNNLSMSKRIFGGFAVLMGLFFTLGGVTISGLSSTENRMRDLVVINQVAADFAELRTLTSQVEASAQTAMGTGLVRDIDGARAGLAELRHAIEGILANAAAAGRGGVVNDALNAVSAEFNRVIATIERRRQLLDKLLAMGIDMGTTAEALDTQAAGAGDAAFASAASRVRTMVDNSRFLIVRFVMTNSPADSGLAEAEATKLKTAYAEASAMTPPTPRTKRFIAALAEDIKALPLVTAELITSSAERASAARALSEALGRLRGAAKAEADDLNERRGAAIGETQAAQSLMETVVIVVIVGLTLIGALMGWLGGRSITVPIIRMTTVMHRLAHNELSVEVPALDRGDEIGRMARAVQVFKENAQAVNHFRAEQAEAEMRAARERRLTMDALAEDFQSHVSGVVHLVGTAAREMGETSLSMASMSEQATNQVATVAVAAEKASDNVRTVAAATEELNSSTAEIGRHVSRANATAVGAANRAAQTDTIVRSLADAAQRIGEIVSMISGIAGQTNMLALNATIEAARAGEMGRGFAVVAGEVKNLASQTARATDEISGQVGAIQQVTAQAVEAIREIGSTIGEIGKVSAVIASAVERQMDATREIARSADLAATGTAEVLANIASVTEVVASAGKAAARVLQDSKILSQTSTELNTQTDSFIGRIRVG